MPGLVPIEPMITVAWSLSCEMFYYLAIPLLIALLGLRSLRARWRVALFLALAWASILAGAFLGGPVKLVMFVAGIVLYEVMQSAYAPAPPGLVSLGALAVGLGAMLVPPGGSAGLALQEGILFSAFFRSSRTRYYGHLSERS